MKNTIIETKEELEIIQNFENDKLEKNEFDELSASLQDAAKNTIKKLSKKRNRLAFDY